jgi:hypothetical protein
MTSVQFPARAGDKPRQVECVWATPPGHSEAALLKTWSSLTGSQTQIDAGELAVLAAQKWSANCKLGTVANSLAEMEAKIHKNPEVEITAMILGRAEWFAPSVLGVCLFHRTWANNVFLDYLAAHPGTMDPTMRVSGIGAGLLSCLCDVARHLKAPTLWLETTPGSAPFYRNVFRLPAANDVLAISREQQDGFCSRFREKWGKPGAA